MKKDDIKLIINYLRRFARDPFSRESFFRFCRYFSLSLGLVREKIRGVDYNIPVYTKNESIHNSVYTKIPKYVIKKICQDIKRYNYGNSFLDIGVGKGYSIKIASKYNFDKVGGIEYSKSLYQTCINNLKKEHINTKYIYNCDAKLFNDYNLFDVFFMNNPFDETIIDVVAKKILESHKDRKCYIYYINPNPIIRQETIIKNGFNLIGTFEDKRESYFTFKLFCNK
jgi:hypothetical protein